MKVAESKKLKPRKKKEVKKSSQLSEDTDSIEVSVGLPDIDLKKFMRCGG
mgnify:CR=1 FL=1|jgi:hypothetical protein